MKKIDDSILNFVQTMNKYPQEECPIVKNGGVRYRSEIAKLQVDEKIYLSPELKFFYEHCEIICDVRHDGHNLKCTSMDIGIGLFCLCSPENLVYRQQGFRWVGTDLKENPEWNPFWLVVADINDDPVVVVTDKEGSPVMASYESGALFPIANSFSDFLDYLSITLELVQKKYNGEIIDDDSCELLEGFIEDLKEVLSKINHNDELVENFIDYLYG